MSLFPSLRTCIAAGEPASSNVSSHSHNHLSILYMDNIYLDLEGTFLAGKRNKTEGTFLAGKRNKTEGTFLAGKRNFQGTSQPLRDCVNSFSPAAPAEAMPKFFLHNLHTNRKSVYTKKTNHDAETQAFTKPGNRNITQTLNE